MIKIKQLIILSVMVLAFLVVGTGAYLYLKKDRQSVAATKSEPLATNVKYNGFQLEIPKVNINTPVITDVAGDNQQVYFKALEKGVAHFKGTKKPGEGGNIFIFGHSSFYPWAAGNYKKIFLDLKDVTAGDEINVWYDQKEFKYKVAETKIVLPSDVWVLNPTTKEQLTLMTCYPPGTTEKRFIVIAEPVK